MSKQLFYLSTLVIIYALFGGGAIFIRQIFAATATVEGTATIVGQQTFTSDDGGEFLFESNGLIAAFTIPEFFYSENLQLQVISNPNAEFVVSHPPLPGLDFVGRVYHVDFLTLSGNSVHILDEPVNVVLPYSASQISGFIESTLAPYHWTGLAWSIVSGSVLDTDTKTITFSTLEFGTFALFAEPEPEPEIPPSSGNVEGGGGGGGGAPISIPSINEISPDQGLYINSSVNSTPLPTNNEQGVIIPPHLESFKYSSENTVPVKDMVEIIEIPSAVYSGDNFLIQGKALPNTTVRVWMDGSPEHLKILTAELGAFMTDKTRSHLEPHYHTAIVSTDGTFTLNHPPIPKRDSGLYMVSVEMIDEDGNRVALSEKKSILVQERTSNVMSKNSSTLLIFLLPFVTFGILWLGKKKFFVYK